MGAFRIIEHYTFDSLYRLASSVSGQQEGVAEAFMTLYYSRLKAKVVEQPAVSTMGLAFLNDVKKVGVDDPKGRNNRKATRLEEGECWLILTERKKKIVH